MKLFVSTIETPLGSFALAVDTAGAVAATAFGGIDALRRRVAAAGFEPDAKPGRAAATQVHEYFAGQRIRFDLPLAANGSAFQHEVWTALGRIPFGETRSYGDLARQLGTSPRAVGRANATNPICLIVPCHRVIGADGSLTGFAFGEKIKRWLLEHEAAVAANRTAA